MRFRVKRIEQFFLITSIAYGKFLHDWKSGEVTFSIFSKIFFFSHLSITSATKIPSNSSMAERTNSPSMTFRSILWLSPEPLSPKIVKFFRIAEQISPTEQLLIVSRIFSSVSIFLFDENQRDFNTQEEGIFLVKLHLLKILKHRTKNSEKSKLLKNSFFRHSFFGQIFLVFSPISKISFRFFPKCSKTFSFFIFGFFSVVYII